MVLKNIVCIFFVVVACTGSVLAMNPQETKTCIEGTEFNIKRVRQLIVEGEEVQGYGNWQDKEISWDGYFLFYNFPDWGQCMYSNSVDTWLILQYQSQEWYKTSFGNLTPQQINDQVRNYIASELGVAVDQIYQYIVFPLSGLGVGNKVSLGYMNLGREGRHEQRYVWNKYIFKYKYREKITNFNILREYWNTLNTRSQSVIESVCRPINQICLDKNNKVFLGKHSVVRPCWKQEVTYNCKTEPLNGCRDLINQGYSLYKSECTDKQEDLCFKWKRHYVRYRNNADEEEASANHAENDGQRIFDFPRSQAGDSGLTGKNGDEADNAIGGRENFGSDIAKTGNNSKKDSGFQKYQSIPTKNDDSNSSGSTSSVGTSSSVSSNQKESKNDAVVAESIKIDPDFLLQEGTYIPCSLTTHFVSDVAGPIQCMINQDVYSSSGRVKLIERGTKAIGMYQSGILQHGMARMHVIWTKLLTPDHKRINLVDTQGVGRLGEAGIDGRVDSHFIQRFGGALMISLIKDVVAHTTERHTNHSKKNTININAYENSRDSVTSIAERMLESSINIPPTMYKRQGEIVGIEVGKDIDFSQIYKFRIKL